MKTLISLIASDLKNCTPKGKHSWRAYLGTWLFSRKFQLLLLFRLGSSFHHRPFFKKNFNPLLTWIMGTFYGSEISFAAKIGRNVKFNHPIGIVIGQGVVIQDNVTIFQHVTFGSHGKPGLPWSYPTIGEGTIIYANSSVIGHITLGKKVVVGAHSLVKDNVPNNCTVVGIPARVIGSKKEEKLREVA